MAQLSVLIPWKDRPALAIALTRNAAQFRGCDAEIVIVNAGGDEALLSNLVRVSCVDNVRYVTLPEGPFNRSLCFNIGALASQSEYLFLVDADIILLTDFLREAIEHLRRCSCFVAVRRIVESDASMIGERDLERYAFLEEIVETRELLTVDGRRAVLKARSSPAQGVRAGDGLIVLKKSDMLAVGGMNASLVGWGYEDTDLQTRLQFMLGIERVELGDVTHLSHPGTLRDFEACIRNREQCNQNYSRGDYLGTLERDAIMWKKLSEQVAPL